MMIDYTISKDDTFQEENLEYTSSVNPTANVIKQAPILILIFKEKNNDWIIEDSLSIGACVENMCLRATELELGTLWIREIEFISEDVAKLLNHENMELNCAVALGVPNQNPQKRPRKELKDIIEWYTE